MLRIVYPICCGMDVHKSFVVACIASTNGQGVTSYQRKRFSTFTGNLRRCAAWLAENDCNDVCMESTGKYWIPIYNILEPTCKIVLTRPKYVKAIRGKKTDKKEAKWTADIFKHDLVSGSFIPPADVRQLRDLVRYHWKLTTYTTGEKNRAQNCLTVSNIKLDDMFSDVFGKAAAAITTYDVLIKTNQKDWKTIKSGLSTKKEYTIDMSPTALGLATDDYITEFKLEFGSVGIGFANVKDPYIEVETKRSQPVGHKIVNNTDVGGRYENEWVYSKDSWPTIINGASKLPKTGGPEFFV